MTRNPIPVTAVFDIGKTNKKFLLFDENLDIVYEKRTALEQATDDDGDPCEDLDRLVDWVCGMFNAAVADEKFRIKALNFSTYGASLVHLDEHGEPVTPLYDYLKPYPGHLEDKFYDRYGGKKRLSLETASPPMGMLNSGLQLFWLKEQKPELFQNIRHTLHFPQYLSYLFTGQVSAEPTSVGCHTAMWDFRNNEYHEWLESEELARLLPPVQPVHSNREVSKAGVRFNAGIGIHDSSAALAPYLYLLDEPFILVSTGTWSISMNPFNREPLTYEELQRDCLCYLNVYGEQVKASRLFLGGEYDHQVGKLNDRFNRGNGNPEVQIDTARLSLLAQADDDGRRLVLETAGNSGPYPGERQGEWEVEGFDKYEAAYHQLMLDLVSIQADCIGLAEGAEPVDTLIVAGGFSRNEFFVRLLATCFPDKKVLAATQPDASALGAALAVTEGREVEKKPPKELLNLESVEPLNGTGIESYSWHAYPSERSKRSDS